MTKKKLKLTTQQEREELLERLWAAHTRKLVEKIENTPAIDLDAATLNAAQKMLTENGINADSLNKDNKQAGRSLAAEAKLLRETELDDDLNAPVPVPPHTEETHSALKRLEEN